MSQVLCDPLDDVDIMAALCHETERRLLLVAPVAAHKRVREMLLPDGLEVLDVFDLAEDAGADDFLDGAIVGRVAED